PFVGGIMIAEGIARARWWDADGQPVGKPWSKVRTPYVAIAAVSEEQTKNTWEPLLEMLRQGSAPDEFNLEPMDSFVALERGRIVPITSSATTIKGFKAVAASLDQTETWVRSNGGVKLAQTLRNNATKLGGSRS
ncbi:terminase, partial [Microbacterium sp. SUBG005]